MGTDDMSGEVEFLRVFCDVLSGHTISERYDFLYTDFICEEIMVRKKTRCEDRDYSYLGGIFVYDNTLAYICVAYRFRREVNLSDPSVDPVSFVLDCLRQLDGELSHA